MLVKSGNIILNTEHIRAAYKTEDTDAAGCKTTRIILEVAGAKPEFYKGAIAEDLWRTLSYVADRDWEQMVWNDFKGSEPE